MYALRNPSKAYYIPQGQTLSPLDKLLALRCSVPGSHSNFGLADENSPGSIHVYVTGPECLPHASHPSDTIPGTRAFPEFDQKAKHCI